MNHKSFKFVLFSFLFSIFLTIPNSVFANEGIDCLTGYKSQCSEEDDCRELWTSGCEYCEDLATPVEYSCSHLSGGGSTDCGEIFESCVVPEVPALSDCPNVGSGSFTGCYLDSADYASSPLVRTGEVIDFDWGEDGPDPLMDVNYFSAKWEGDFNFPTTGTYRFNALTDDGVRVYVDGIKWIDEWYDKGAWDVYYADIGLVAGTHRVKVEYYERDGDASAQVWWEFSYPGISPNAPSISGPNTGSPNTNYTYTFTATDPEGDNIRYGIDWNMDGDEDDWLPVASYTTSGNPRSTTYSWTIGEHIFQALTKDESGIRSGWTIFNVSISNSPINGVCGTADGVIFTSEATGYLPYVQCAVGTSSDTDFPAVGDTQNWTCLGSGVGHTDASCSATRSNETFTLTLTANPGPGGSIVSQDGYIDTSYCASPCVVDFAAGSPPVTLLPVPQSSYWRFTGWTGACSGTGVCTVDVSSNISVGATFGTRAFIYKEL